MLNPLFQFEEMGEQGGRIRGRLMRVNQLLLVEKLKTAGLYGVFTECFPGSAEGGDEKRG